MAASRAHRLGLCSWSARARTPAELARACRDVGVDAVQLALDPVREAGAGAADVRRVLEEAGVEVRSGMMGTLGEDYSSLESIRATGGVRVHAHWEENLARARANASLARELGVDLVTFHAGFLPDERDDPERPVLLERLRALADAFAEKGVAVAFETGQETAETLLGVLTDLDRPTAGVNFDPANMLLYDRGDPVDALRRLAPHVCQIHVKDAVRTRVPGTWGDEVPVGTGEVDWPAFFGVVRDAGLGVDLMIEREAGQDRRADLRRAAALVRRELARTGGAA